jgi:hypothetical protein
MMVSFTGCLQSVKQVQQQPAADKADYDASLSQAFDLCSRYFLPNTQARSGEVDINQELAKVNEERKRITQVFHSPAGIAYLDQRLAGESDDIYTICMLLVLSESQSSAALPIIKRYTVIEGTVGERARYFMGTLKEDE